MPRRFGAGVLVILFLVLGLSGCEPYAPSGKPGSIDVDVDVEADGGAEVTVAADRTERSTAELRRLGRLVGDALLPPGYRTKVEPNRGGYPFVVLHADDAYRPGRSVRYSFDARAMCRALFADGATEVSVSLGLPDVPSRPDPGSRAAGDPFEGFYWTVHQGDPGPTASVVMRPDRKSVV